MESSALIFPRNESAITPSNANKMGKKTHRNRASLCVSLLADFFSASLSWCEPLTLLFEANWMCITFYMNRCNRWLAIFPSVLPFALCASLTLSLVGEKFRTRKYLTLSKSRTPNQSSKSKALFLSASQKRFDVFADSLEMSNFLLWHF